MIDAKTLEAVFSISGMVFGFMALIIAWLTRGSRANALEIQKLKDDNDAQADRIKSLETHTANLPTKDDFHSLDLKLSEMGGNLDTVSTKLEAVGRVANRIDDYLLTNTVNGGGKS
ncbi:DUF2730 family protein [Roseibium sp. CAU 1637]|uniref:DUF2730 family protein n=1 Tax=Roseibium limicola TaxID=2816037 RepID=A0A939J7C4_9HYPH|nr:DUF2730 family protein [Roseibium limicola]MBO0346027.1 DUF2730 family protein [Roseibium limicola]